MAAAARRPPRWQPLQGDLQGGSQCTHRGTAVQEIQSVYLLPRGERGGKFVWGAGGRRDSDLCWNIQEHTLYCPHHLADLILN